MSEKPGILFVTPVLGHPPKGGPELRIENSIKALAQISSVTLYCRISRSQIGGDAAVAYLSNIVDKIYFPQLPQRNLSVFSRVMSALNIMTCRLFGREMFPQKTDSELEFHDVIETAETAGVSVIWLGYGNISYPLLQYIKDHSTIPVVVDTDSVWSLFVLRGGPFAKEEGERKRIEAEGKAKEEEERWGTRLADVTTAVSGVDAEYYRSLTEEPARVHLFTNVIDIGAYRTVSPPDDFRTPCMYLAGTFWPDSPMEDSARWMLEFVLPLVKRDVPDIHFYIAGRGSDTILADVKDENVTVAGELPSVLPYLTNATVAIVPLRFESGTRFKILEAGACGIPVVSTTLGAEGIPTTDGKDILIADTPEDFAHAIITVIRDSQLAERLGSNLRELITGKYSVDALADEGLSILRYIRNQSKQYPDEVV